MENEKEVTIIRYKRVNQYKWCFCNDFALMDIIVNGNKNHYSYCEKHGEELHTIYRNKGYTITNEYR